MQRRGVKGFLAGKLHREAGVAEGPCRRDKLKKFQESLGGEYQVLYLKGLEERLCSKTSSMIRLRTSLPAESTEPLLPN